jgi:hypothetical protein
VIAFFHLHQHADPSRDTARRSNSILPMTR